jgi:hypothetical protein
MADARILKFDVGGPTDKALGRVAIATHSSSNTEAFRRSVAIADVIVRGRNEGKKIYMEDENGVRQEIEIV